MQNTTIETRVGSDGMLHIDLPIAAKDTKVLVTISYTTCDIEKDRLSFIEGIKKFREENAVAEENIDTIWFDSYRKGVKERNIEL
ncbi:hypothetical protein TI05_12090 [Achromatium sp. WMS3]|nr:hypothetical protein TI05_12090 [Achromatium sp. WMS3]